MSEIAIASINTFGTTSPQADFVPPSEEPVFILTSGQLQDLITAAVEKAIQPLQDRISALEEERDVDRQEMAAMRSQIAALESTQETQADNQLIQLCAELTTLQNDLKRFKVFTTPQKVEDLWAWVEELDKRTEVKPQPMQKDRGDILRALLAANGGKMLAKDARQKMRLSEATFSVLLSTTKDKIETRPYHVNKSAKVLILRV